MKPTLLLLSLLPALTTSLTLPEHRNGPILIPTPNYAPLDLNKLNPPPKTSPLTPEKGAETTIKESTGPSTRPHHKFHLRPDPSIRSAAIRKLGLLGTNLTFPSTTPLLASIPNNRNGTVHTSRSDPSRLLFLRPTHSSFGLDERPEYSLAQGDIDDEEEEEGTMWERWTVGSTKEVVEDEGWNLKEVERWWLGVGESYGGWLACERGEGGWGVYWMESVFGGEGCGKPFRMEVVWE